MHNGTTKLLMCPSNPYIYTPFRDMKLPIGSYDVLGRVGIGIRGSNT